VDTFGQDVARRSSGVPYWGCGCGEPQRCRPNDARAQHCFVIVFLCRLQITALMSSGSLHTHGSSSSRARSLWYLSSRQTPRRTSDRRPTRRSANPRGSSVLCSCMPSQPRDLRCALCKARDIFFLMNFKLHVTVGVVPPVPIHSNIVRASVRTPTLYDQAPR
jgi:hypothetical protein